MSIDYVDRFISIYCNHCGEGLSADSPDRTHPEVAEAAKALGWLWLGLEVHLCARCGGDKYLQQLYELEVLQLRRLRGSELARQIAEDRSRRTERDRPAVRIARDRSRVRRRGRKDAARSSSDGKS